MIESASARSQGPVARAARPELGELGAYREAFARCQAELRALTSDEAVGLFGPGSMHWTLFREPLLVVGGLRAIALQMTHPMVAAGIAQNSNFRRDVLGRAKRTFTAMYEMVFGATSEALGASMRVFSLHRKVHGQVPDAGAGAWGGRVVHAMSPELLDWVLSTCVDTSVLVFETFVRPLSLDEKRTYYKESFRLGLQFGLRPEFRAPDWDSFQEAFHGALEGSELLVGPSAQEVIYDLFSAPITRGPLDELVTTALLPERWRRAYGLRWEKADQAAWKALVRAVRATNRRVPEPYRFVVAWHQAMYRVERARGGKGTLWQRAINRLDHRVDLPFSIRPVALAATDDD